MGKSKHLADLLSASGLIGAEDIESDAIPPSGATTYATINDLPLTGLTSGALAYISSTNTFYIANGDGWYKVTTVNTAPNITNVASSFPRGSLDLSNVIIEAVGSDAEGIPVSISYQLEPASVPFVNGLSTVGDVLTVDIVTANTSGSANVVVSASDGVNISTVKSLINFSTFDGSVDFLLIGGGGGGGGIIDGGGGAGGYRASWGTGSDGSSGNSGGLSALESQIALSPGTAYTVTVGAGGQGGLGYNNGANHRGHKGRNTSISGSDITTLTAEGGGGGSGLSVTSSEIDGGSGGGGGNIQDGGTGTANQGHNGGNDSNAGNNTGGGGGAGAVGQNAPTTTSSGAGGDGLPSTITGVSVTRAGGGGGGIRQTTGTASGAGGAGGGGNGGYQSLAAVDYNGGAGTQTTATHAKQHTGSGGGGGGYNNVGTSLQQGGNGASGIAILRVPSAASYDAATLASDITSANNINVQYLNTGIYTEDVNYGDVKLLLDGTSKTVDQSLNQLTFTEIGSVSVTTTDPGTHPFATSFLDFGSSAGSRYLTNSSSDWAFGTGQFTAEGWAYVNSHKSYQKLLTTRPTNAGWSTAWDIGMDSSGKITIYSNTFLQQSAASAVPTGQWFHYAWTRDASNVCRLFVDGVVVDTDTITTNFDKTDLGIGNFPVTPQAGEQLYGYQTGIRITTGVARYTSAFTPSTTAFPHHSTASGGDHVLIFQQTTQTQYDGVTDTSSSCIWTPSFT